MVKVERGEKDFGGRREGGTKNEKSTKSVSEGQTKFRHLPVPEPSRETRKKGGSSNRGPRSNRGKRGCKKTGKGRLKGTCAGVQR